MNNKMSGDLKKIQITGKYFVEIWKAIGMEGIDDKVSWLGYSDYALTGGASHVPYFPESLCPTTCNVLTGLTHMCTPSCRCSS